MDLQKIISGIPMFRELPVEQVAEVADIVVEHSYRKGKVIFSEGEAATGFYVVISGLVKIFKISADGKEQILHLTSSGQPFGEVPMFSGTNFPANAETVEKSRVLFFPRDQFLELLKRDPNLSMKLLADFSRRLRYLIRLIEELSLKEVPERLSAYLLYLSEKNEDSDEVQLPVTKGHLAALLGTIPETLSRILSRMSSRGLIEVRGRKIRLIDRRSLEELSAGGKSFQ